MRRRSLPTILGALTGSVLLSLTVTGSAQAATGVLVINDIPHENPSGCIEAEAPGPMEIVNDTDQTATVYVQAGCQGASFGQVAPGASGQFFGGSVAIP